jgi:hypothetical protein
MKTNNHNNSYKHKKNKLIMSNLIDAVKKIKPKDVLRDIGIVVVTAGILIGMGFCEDQVRKVLYGENQSDYNSSQPILTYTLNR